MRVGLPAGLKPAPGGSQRCGGELEPGEMWPAASVSASEGQGGAAGAADEPGAGWTG